MTNSPESVDAERDKYIDDFKAKYKRDSDKPGLRPGPGFEVLRLRLRETFDNLTSDDACQAVWNPPKKGDPNVSPQTGGTFKGKSPQEQAEAEREKQWKEELNLVSFEDEEIAVQSQIWADVQNELWRRRFESGAWPPREGSDAPDPTKDIDPYKLFDERWRKYEKEQGGSSPADEKPSPPDIKPSPAKPTPDKPRPEVKTEGNPTGFNVKLCAHALFRRCFDVPYIPGNCTEMSKALVSDQDNMVSSIRLNDEAGTCSFYV